MSKKKAAKTSSIQNETYEELIAQDPDFYSGYSTFELPNGDKYEGEFCAHISGLIWRQGKGIYTTVDGQTYSCHWDGDKINETKEIEIIYSNGTKYMGYLSKNKYTGNGIYQLENQTSLLCKFVDNKPVGDLILVDQNGQIWNGYAGKDNSLLLPEHIYFQSLNNNAGKGSINLERCKIELSTENVQETASNETLKYADVRNLEAQIFAKSQKTKSDIKLEDSEWYQNYINFIDTYSEVIAKVENDGIDSLTSNEHKLFEEYTNFEKSYKRIFNDFKNKTPKLETENDLFQLIHSQK